MELKDVILSTLAEMEEPVQKKEEFSKIKREEPKKVKSEPVQSVEKVQNKSTLDGELTYLTSIRERLLVLFEGFQAPNNKNIEAKVDMTLNFLEYMLATIDSRVESLKKDGKNE